jgi:predicted phage terminase large subunit-like protein
MGGAVTGAGAGVLQDCFGGFLVVDDASKPEDAKSEVMRNKVISYFDETLMNRLNNPQKTIIVVIAQRLNQLDICGHIERSYPEKFKILRFKTLDEDKNISIWPEKHPVKDLLKIKNLNPFYFYSQYQQEPIIAGGTILRQAWMKYFESLPEFYKIIQSWDTAFKTGEHNDYSVGTTWGVKNTQFGDDYYLINMFRGKLEYPQLKAKIIELNDQYSPSEILVEDKASGQSILQELKQSGLGKLKPVKVDKDKESRVHSITALFESGRVYFDKNANYLSDLIGELISFPNGSHDDAVDSISQALNYLNRPKKQVIFR